MTTKDITKTIIKRFAKGDTVIHFQIVNASRYNAVNNAMAGLRVLGWKIKGSRKVRKGFLTVTILEGK